MPKKANVSVIIPCYRCSDTVGRAVASIAEQSALPLEVILIDDCSGDATLATLYRVQASYPKDWIRVIALTENAGPGTARNIGWEAATQAYIAFLDSDDSWHPQKIEIQYGWMQAHQDVALTGHACLQVDEAEALPENNYLEINGLGFYEVSKKKLLLSNRFSTPTVMLRREIVQRFQDGKRYCEDYQLWTEICCSGLRCYRSELPLAYLYKAPYGEAGLSSALWKMEKGELGVYFFLFEFQHIRRDRLVLLTGWSLIKFLRRLTSSKFTKWVMHR